jgi:sulfur carrier protein
MSEEIVVNGVASATDASTVEELLRAHGLSGRRGVAVALNGAVIPRCDWPSARLRGGDQVEIIKATGGG